MPSPENDRGRAPAPKGPEHLLADLRRRFRTDSALPGGYLDRIRSMLACLHTHAAATGGDRQAATWHAEQSLSLKADLEAVATDAQAAAEAIRSQVDDRGDVLGDLLELCADLVAAADSLAAPLNAREVYEFYGRADSVLRRLGRISVLGGLPVPAEASAANELRRQGTACAKLIDADLPSWSAAAEWLKRLPMCCAYHEHGAGDLKGDEGLPDLVVDGSYQPFNDATPDWQRFYIFGDEVETQRRTSSIAWRLRTAWHAASHRFVHHLNAEPNRYYDFGDEDARRIALLAALTFNKDFDGAVLGLGWSWDLSASGCEIDGRHGAWVYLTSEYQAEQVLLDLVRLAADSLAAPVGAEPSAAAMMSVAEELKGLLHAAPYTSRKRGPKQRHDAKADRELARDWGQARDARISKTDFCSDRGMKVIDLDRALARVRGQRRGAK